MEISEAGQGKDVNIGLHVQGKNFTPEGLHILRYNSPHLSHSHKNSGGQSWHFDIIREDGEAVRLTEVDGVPKAISLQDLLGEWYAIAAEARRLVRAPFYKWDEEFSLPEGEEKMQSVAQEILSGMEKYAPFKQVLEIEKRPNLPRR